MKVQIYWDSLFLMNLLINWGVLKLLQRRFALGAIEVRIWLASLVGGSTYIVVFICFSQNVLWQLFATLSSVVLMVCIVLGKDKHRLVGKAFRWGMLYSFIISGILRVVLKQYRSIWGGEVAIEFILVGVLLCVKIGMWYIEKDRGKQKRSICTVTLESAGTTTTIKALMDTGNRLIEPISGKPVCIVEEDVLMRLPLEKSSFFRAIPFRSVGCERGILYGVQIPKVRIEDEKSTYVVNDIVCAGIGDKLSAKSEYQMIVHPDLIIEQQ